MYYDSLAIPYGLIMIHRAEDIQGKAFVSTERKRVSGKTLKLRWLYPGWLIHVEEVLS